MSTHPNNRTVHTVGLLVINEHQELLLLADHKPSRQTKWKLFSENVTPDRNLMSTAQSLVKSKLHVRIPSDAFEEFDTTATRDFPGNKTFELHPVVVLVAKSHVKIEKLQTADWFSVDRVGELNMPEEHKDLINKMLV